MPDSTYSLLQKIMDPADLRRLPRAQLVPLASELRAFLLASVSKTGGHLSSNLGTVELTVALHYVFNTPHDRLVWDVGHQTYPHKILTGRRERMASLRQLGGLSGFPQRTESEYDTFGTAHSSTSISAALGMAMAARIKGEDRHSVAIIGDGALTAGMAFEALNNGGIADCNLLVILNDNDMSISPPVGALNRYLAQLMTGQLFSAAKNVGKSVLKGAPPLFELAKRFEEHAKGMVVPATLFEKFGFNYTGPIDGHDLDSLVPTLENLRRLGGPQFLHVVTKKGQGYKLAEADPVAYHGPGKFDPAVGLQVSSAPTKPTFTQVFGQWLCDMAEHDKRLVGITPAMREGSGLVEFEKRFPQRYFDVGIAEQHAVTFAAGLACEGLKPVVAIYSTFLQRAYDQIIHDVCIQSLPVIFAMDRGGLVGADGPTHHGVFDIAYTRSLPNMTVMAPKDEAELRDMMLTCVLHTAGPTAIRFPRGNGLGVDISRAPKPLEIGKGELLREAPAGERHVVLIPYGAMVENALKAADLLAQHGIFCSVVNPRFAKPLDEELLQRTIGSHRLAVTIEDHALQGGFGSAVLEFASDNRLLSHTTLLRIGIADEFIPHGTPDELYELCGLTPEAICARIRQAEGSTAIRLKSFREVKISMNA